MTRPARKGLPVRGLLLAVMVALAAYFGLVNPHAHGMLKHGLSQSHRSKPKPPVPIAWVPPNAVPPFPIHEPDGILMVYGQSQPLWAVNANAMGPVASTTKLMTAYLTMRALPLSQVVTISDSAAGTGGSEMFMRPHDRFTVGQLLTGMLLRSANNAAVALSQAVAGHQANFVQMMNRTAVKMGLLHTHYADPDGISPGSASSARDLAILAQADLQSPILRHIMRMQRTSLPENPIVVNIDGMVWRDPTSLGLKTGWTSASQACLVFAARRPVDGHLVTLVGVLLHGAQFPVEYSDAQALLNWGFKAIRPTVSSLGQQGKLPRNLNP